MDLATPGDPKSTAGKRLNRYKAWYYSQPKLVRVAALPMVIGISVTAPQMFSFVGVELWLSFVVFMLALFINSYNQYLDSLLIDDIADTREKTKRCETEIGKYVHLNMIFNELVVNKARVLLNTIQHSASSTLNAKKYILKESAYEKNMRRLFWMLSKSLDKYARINRDERERFRVVYMSPSEDSEFLEAKIYYPDDAPPHSVREKSKHFSRDGRSLAAYVWRTDSNAPFIIDNVPEYVENHAEQGVFCYTSDAQKDYLKSILCYRVDDHDSGEVLGVICIDSNSTDAFNGCLGKHFSEYLVESFGKRVVYETWFSAMMESLGPFKRTSQRGTRGTK